MKLDDIKVDFIDDGDQPKTQVAENMDKADQDNNFEVHFESKGKLESDDTDKGGSAE